jgi:hypothetical protein
MLVGDGLQAVPVRDAINGVPYRKMTGYRMTTVSLYRCGGSQ